MKIRPFTKYSFLLSIFFFVSDQAVVKEVLGARGKLLSDMVLMSIFIFFTHQIVKIIRSDKNQKYTFGKGYTKGVLLGFYASGIYLLISVLITALFSTSTMDFVNRVLGSLPNLVAEGVVKVILILLFSFVLPLYYLIFKKTKNRGGLDEILFRD